MPLVSERLPELGSAAVPETTGLLPRSVVVLASAVVDALADLPEAERRLVSRAVPKRQHEFATGRSLARRALAQLGVADFPLLADADRAPLWPEGVVGSISHSHGLCVVAAARRGELQAVGVDVEEAEGVRPELWRRVLSNEEERWLRARPEPEQLRLAAVYFSAKEAFYKAQFPLTRARLGFHDVTLEIDPARGQFRARSAGFAHPITGTFALRSRWVLTGLALRHGDLPA